MLVYVYLRVHLPPRRLQPSSPLPPVERGQLEQLAPERLGPSVAARPPSAAPARCGGPAARARAARERRVGSVSAAVPFRGGGGRYGGGSAQRPGLVGRSSAKSVAAVAAGMCTVAPRRIERRGERHCGGVRSGMSLGAAAAAADGKPPPRAAVAASVDSRVDARVEPARGSGDARACHRLDAHPILQRQRRKQLRETRAHSVPRRRPLRRWWRRLVDGWQRRAPLVTRRPSSERRAAARRRRRRRQRRRPLLSFPL